MVSCKSTGRTLEALEQTAPPLSSAQVLMGPVHIRDTRDVPGPPRPHGLWEDLQHVKTPCELRPTEGIHRDTPWTWRETLQFQRSHSRSWAGPFLLKVANSIRRGFLIRVVGRESRAQSPRSVNGSLDYDFYYFKEETFSGNVSPK